MAFIIHVAANFLMIVLDAIWWVIGMRVATRPVWRVLISLFMAVQMVAAINELFGRIGLSQLDLSQVPTVIMAATVIWHFFGPATLLALGTVFGCRFLLRRHVRPHPGPLHQERENLPQGVRKSDVGTTRREFIGACAALAPPLFTFGVAGFAFEQLKEFRLRRFTLAIPSLPRQLDGLTIAHVSDVHVGEWTHGPVLREIVEATNALRADVVAVTGDLINYELSELPEAISLVKKMQGRYGLWMIEGNHDLLQDGVAFEHRVKASGISLLTDESAVANVRGYPVQFFGMRWMDGVGHHRDHLTTSQMQALMKQRHAEAFPILLAHHPHAFDAAVTANLPLTLTGHTHGGQLMLAQDIGVGPALFRYWSGRYQRGNSQMIVSNGVGNMFPLRINAPAEIVHITLRSGVT